WTCGGPADRHFARRAWHHAAQLRPRPQPDFFVRGKARLAALGRLVALVGGNRNASNAYYLTGRDPLRLLLWLLHPPGPARHLTDQPAAPPARRPGRRGGGGGGVLSPPVA